MVQIGKLGLVDRIVKPDFFRQEQRAAGQQAVVYARDQGSPFAGCDELQGLIQYDERGLLDRYIAEIPTPDFNGEGVISPGKVRTAPLRHRFGVVNRYDPATGGRNALLQSSRRGAQRTTEVVANTALPDEARSKHTRHRDHGCITGHGPIDHVLKDVGHGFVEDKITQIPARSFVNRVAFVHGSLQARSPGSFSSRSFRIAFHGAP
jgi:hypothetical protein